MQLLTNKDVSVRKLSHMRTWLCATYHIISNVLYRPPCFHDCVDYETRSCACSRTKKTYVCTLFDLRSRVSTQISRLSHVHAQVHTLKDMSSHTFCLMEMFASTVWHLVSHYFVWYEGTINVMFTQKTLLGCVYVQLLTYEDVSVCNSLTWSPRMRTNVQLKTRSHACVHVFLTKTYLYRSFVIWDLCLYHVLSHYFDRKECFYTTVGIQGSVFEK